ncbi:TRAP-type C4-dicarboxylate transport system permease small subunit [Aliiruegeria haliotis]|uniref:TRAP transporter small permease protein n=1 Tax=Aliiruegeria haliotis TaxID=1280846 RepID=A0A2T0RDV3_9RHOB|nr:TRAP transporter small permease [Aliiruegeria haliotis]PRY19342.1 TRAP-type C4-dicarboxylate transport system permease small subunit [Aliiruegeria haliotis]
MLTAFFQRFCDILFTATSALCRILLLVMAIDILNLVFGRYVLSKSPMWGEDLAILCLVWFSLLSVALAIRDGQHMRVVLLINAFPAKLRHSTEIINHVLAIGFSILMVVKGIDLCLLNLNNTMSGLGISTFWLFLAMPLSGALCLVALLEITKEQLWSPTQ